jgi:hypothetical protein
MQEVNRTQNAHGYDVFKITTDRGEFEISFENNLDLYWRFINKENMLESKEKQELIITKENCFIYELFYKLYEGIKRNRVYYNYEENNYKEEKVNNLYRDGKIEWLSDDFYDEIASKLTIEKEDETFKVTFYKSKDLFKTFSIRFSNSGSRYNPFQINFMTMYQELKTYDPNCHQIHIDEILYREKVLKKGK